MVRAESDGSLFEPFIRNNLVAIGWPALGDLGHIKSREELIPLLHEGYPERPSVRIPITFEVSNKEH